MFSLAGKTTREISNIHIIGCVLAVGHDFRFGLAFRHEMKFKQHQRLYRFHIRLSAGIRIGDGRYEAISRAIHPHLWRMRFS
jgi:hypothetical protein